MLSGGGDMASRGVSTDRSWGCVLCWVTPPLKGPVSNVGPREAREATIYTGLFRGVGVWWRQGRRRLWSSGTILFLRGGSNAAFCHAAQTQKGHRVGLGSEESCAQAGLGALACFVPHDCGEGHSGVFMSETDPGLSPKDAENHLGRNSKVSLPPRST